MESGQFTLTASIAALGPVTQAELARGLAMDQSSLTRTLALVHKRGWIKKRVATDRRSRVFVATRAGRAEVERARPHWQRAQQRLMAAMGSERAGMLAALIQDASLALRDADADEATIPRRLGKRSQPTATFVPLA
jgi:DNA-binding MarR family transcriptional regulator